MPHLDAVCYSPTEVVGLPVNEGELIGRGASEGAFHGHGAEHYQYLLRPLPVQEYYCFVAHSKVRCYTKVVLNL